MHTFVGTYLHSYVLCIVKTFDGENFNKLCSHLQNLDLKDANY